MVAIIGLAVAAGAAFLFWMFIRKNQAPAQPNPLAQAANLASPGSVTSTLANTTFGIGYATAKYGIKAAELVANGALDLGGAAVNAGASALSKTATLGGTVVQGASKATTAIAAAGGQVLKAGIGLPMTVAKTQISAVKDVATDAGKYIGSGVSTAANDVTGGVVSAGKKVGSGVASAVKSITSIF